MLINSVPLAASREGSALEMHQSAGEGVVYSVVIQCSIEIQGKTL